MLLGKYLRPGFATINQPSAAKEIKNFGNPDEGIYRGAQPSKEGIKALKEMGVKTIINLRDDKKKIKKEQKIVESLDMDFVSIPMSGLEGPDKRDVVRFIELLKNSQNKPIFFHCRRGAERAGIMWACYPVAVDGWAPDEAHAEMKKFKFRSFWYPHLRKYLYDFSKDYGYEKEYTNNPFTKMKEWFLTQVVYSPLQGKARAQ